MCLGEGGCRGKAVAVIQEFKEHSICMLIANIKKDILETIHHFILMLIGKF